MYHSEQGIHTLTQALERTIMLETVLMMDMELSSLTDVHHLWYPVSVLPLPLLATCVPELGRPVSHMGMDTMANSKSMTFNLNQVFSEF